MPTPIGFLVERTRRPLFSSAAGAVFEDGQPALSPLGDGLAPVPAISMGTLRAGAHIDLIDGRRWFLIEWSDSGGSRWEPPAHRREEIEAREAEMRQELLRLPAARVDPSGKRRQLNSPGLGHTGMRRHDSLGRKFREIVRRLYAEQIPAPLRYRRQVAQHLCEDIEHGTDGTSPRRWHILRSSSLELAVWM